MNTPLYISSPAILCNLGGDLNIILENLKEGNIYLEHSDIFSPQMPTPLGLIKSALPKIPNEFVNYQSKNSQIILYLLQQIEKPIKDAIDKFGSHRVAIIAGSSTSGILEGEIFLNQHFNQKQTSSAYHYKQQEMGSVSEFAFKYLQLNSFHLTLSTACSSSANIFHSAAQWINADLCDAVILIAADTLSQLTVQGFQSLEAVSNQITNPFDQRRDGINLGEGGAACLLSKTPDANKIQYLSSGSSSDAHHMSAPHPDGIGAEKAMTLALKAADLKAEDINYINTHGTGTVLNDQMESHAIERVFGNQTFCSSSKALTGHTLGASGLIEILFCYVLLSNFNTNRYLPFQPNFKNRDPSLSDINILSKQQCYAAKNKVRMLSNSFAFGGNNSSVILERNFE